MGIPHVDFVVMHSYELAITHFDYFFFTENCSYHLLSLIEVAMPELQLTEQFKGWVIPIDTLKLLDRDHLLSKVTYHPSHATTIKYRRSLLSDAENALALEVFEQGPDSLKEKLNQFPKDRQAAILDLAYDYQRYRKIQDADVLEAKLSQNERRFLLTRAALHVKSQPLNIQTPDTRPDRGHETTRFTLGGGALNHQGYASIGFRAAYHDLLDPTPGYSSHPQLEFFNAKIRYQPKKNRLELDRLTIIDIASLEPRDDFFNNISWKVHAGWQGLPYENDELRTVFTLNGGPGLTYTLGHSQNSFIYGFAQAALNYGNIYNSHYLAGLGITTGLVTDIVPKWKIHLQFNYLKGMTNEKSSTASISLQQGFYLTKDLMFKLDINRQKVLSHFSTDVSGEFRFYF